MIVIMLAAFLLPLLGSGPADEDTYMQMIYGCVNNWWTVLVHTNNFNANRELVSPIIFPINDNTC